MPGANSARRSERGDSDRRVDRSPEASASSHEELPLLYRTPDEWAAMALGDPLSLLNDHAYLEKKAASNALELLNRWPEPVPPEPWTLTLSAIASDEAAHLSSVVRLLSGASGGRLERTHRNDYANQLRQHVRKADAVPRSSSIGSSFRR